jgi:hypothetical protein
MFVIQSPWDIKQGKELPEYERSTKRHHRMVQSLIQQMRDAYPENVFLSVPQGLWMVELWRLYEAEQLPELTHLVAEDKGQTRQALFADPFGHGGDLAVQEGALLWLHVIYRIDLDAYPYSTRTQYDLKALAQSICESDRYSRMGGETSNNALESNSDES